MNAPRERAARMTTPERSLVFLLRLGAAILSLAALTAVMPFSWMAAVHEWFGLGTLPDLPIVGYLTRSLSALYAYHGVLTFFLSLDVRRYGPLIDCNAICLFAFGVFVLILDVTLGMPQLWIVSEGPLLLAFAGAVLWLRRKASAAHA
jgi:hypothetical protein